jgi:hypothetical protein
MKKLVLSVSIIVAASSAYALQTPAQQSGSIVKSVVRSILSDSGLALLSITKITVTNDRAKAQLTNQKGECLAIPYKVTADNQGFPSVEVDKVAFAICD